MFLWTVYWWINLVAVQRSNFSSHKRLAVYFAIAFLQYFRQSAWLMWDKHFFFILWFQRELKTVLIRFLSSEVQQIFYLKQRQDLVPYRSRFRHSSAVETSMIFAVVWQKLHQREWSLWAEAGRVNLWRALAKDCTLGGRDFEQPHIFETNDGWTNTTSTWDQFTIL